MMNLSNYFLRKYSEDQLIKWFQQVCIAEAITCFLLYGIAMIWKRYDEEGIWATVFIIIVGNLHGLFFTLYLLLCLPARKIFKWDDEDFVFALMAAFFPFATIWIEKKLAKKDRNIE